MNIQKYNIEKLPFFNSYIPDSNTKAIIDVKEFTLWLEQVQHVDFLSDSEEIEREEAYKELETGKTLDLKDAMGQW